MEREESTRSSRDLQFNSTPLSFSYPLKFDDVSRNLWRIWFQAANRDCDKVKIYFKG